MTHGGEWEFLLDLELLELFRLDAPPLDLPDLDLAPPTRGVAPPEIAGKGVPVASGGGETVRALMGLRSGGTASSGSGWFVVPTIICTKKRHQV